MTGGAELPPHSTTGQVNNIRQRGEGEKYMTSCACFTSHLLQTGYRLEQLVIHSCKDTRAGTCKSEARVLTF